MKKYLFLLLCLIACSVAFVSCNDDDEAGTGASAWLVGTWYTRMYFVDDEYDDGDFNVFVLQKDGKCEWEDIEGRWSYKSGKLTMQYEDEGEIHRFHFQIMEHTDDNFTYTCTWSSNEDGGSWSSNHYQGEAYKD